MWKFFARKGFAVLIIAVFALVFILPAEAKDSDDFGAKLAAANARIEAARARGQAADATQKVFSAAAKQARTEADAYSQMYRWLKAAEVQAAKLTVPDKGRGFPRPLKALVLAIPTTVGALMVGAVEGVTHPTTSPLEYLVVPSFCRGINTAITQGGTNLVQLGREVLTPWGNIAYANPELLYPSALRVMAWYPLAQMAATAAYMVPIGLTATSGLVAFDGVSQTGGVLIAGSMGGVSGFGVGEFVNAVEKPVTKALMK